ncbi:MAG: helix-hairpin-helix domain-containing protein, partial [Clostridia bacterium]|nr:helix-hairpin-helix domain-containing protein [Clostridia bacterium]
MKIQGTVEEIIFANQSNGFTVADINCSGELWTVVGIMPFINPGETLIIEGEQTFHPDYGEQIKVKNYKTLTSDNDVDNIEKFLSSGVIKGIGPVTAKKLVHRFGQDTLDVMRFSPEKLMQVDGIGKKKAQIIAQSYEEQSDVREVILFLQKYNITPYCAMRIYKNYGSESISVVKENPYRLAEQITGIGFKTADNIAMSMGIEKHSPYRIAAGIKFVLTKCAANGHCYLPESTLIEDTCRLLDVDADLVQHSIK